MSYSNQDIQLANRALSHIDPSNRETWIKIGAALKSGFGEDQGLTMWTDWSKQADNYHEKSAASV
jgi:putative DNA primase/helicase